MSYRRVPPPGDCDEGLAMMACGLRFSKFAPDPVWDQGAGVHAQDQAHQADFRGGSTA